VQSLSVTDAATIETVVYTELAEYPLPFGRSGIQLDLTPFEKKLFLRNIA